MRKFLLCALALVTCGCAALPVDVYSHVVESPAVIDAAPADIEASPVADVEPVQHSAAIFDVLDSLPVDFERGPVPEYARVEYFGKAWRDVEGVGCDPRNRVLLRDLTEVVLDDDGCKVLSGSLDDPYTGERIEFRRGQDTSAMVQIDHIVSLKDAWDSGAHRWTQDERVRFANDLSNLVAVGASVNQSKGARTAAQWLPWEPFECDYVTAQVLVKADYGLSVTVDEKHVMMQVLSECHESDGAPW